MPATYTTSGGFSLMAAKALDKHGFNSEEILLSCGIDSNSLMKPDLRVPIDQVGELFNRSASITGNNAFGLIIGTFISPITYQALSMSMWLSGSLREALDRLVRYGQLISDAGESGYEESADEYTVWSKLPGSDSDFIEFVSPVAMDALYSSVISFCRSVTEDGFAPRKVSLIRQAPRDSQAYLDFFGCQVFFNEPRLSICFDKNSLNQPLPGGQPELLDHSDHVIVESLSRFKRDDIVSRLRAKLLERLPSGKPAQSQIASDLHCSMRSLQRKLHERGLTYRTVLDEVRREQGLKYIAQSHLPIADISYLLGYSSPTNFSRSFTAWTGMTPREYRRRVARA